MQNYDFEVVNGGVDNKASLLLFPTEETLPKHSEVSSQRSGQEDFDKLSVLKSSRLTSSTETQDGMTLYAMDQTEREVERMTSKMSALRFIPPSIRFGRGGKRGGFSRS